MNAIQKALTEIRYTIPPEVLQIGFVENYNRVNQITSLDERILNSVIRSRVMVDANLVGGVTLHIPIADCENVVSTLYNEFIITVPRNKTNYRSIVALYSLLSNTGTGTALPVYQTSPLITQAFNMYSSLSNVNVIQTSRLELIGENVILVQDPSQYIFNAILKCAVEFDKNMSDMHPRYMRDFAKLCIHAVKSYIYNNFKVKLDQGYIYAGHELGTVTEIIDSYSDQEEMYQDFLTNTFQKIAFMNDRDNHNKFIRAQLGNTI